MLDSIIHTDIRLFETMDILYPDPEYKDIIQPDEVVTWVASSQWALHPGQMIWKPKHV
jgi:hypothetical protein